MSRSRVYSCNLFLILLFLLVGCAPSRFLKEDELMLRSVSLKSDDNSQSTSTLSGYIRQHPNAKWFNLLKVPLGIYCISGRDSTLRVNRFFRKLGEAPVIYDSVQTEKSRRDIEAAVKNLGYLNAQVEVKQRRHDKRTDVCYQIHPGECYHISHLERKIDDEAIDSAVTAHWDQTLVQDGMPFDVNLLDGERSRITNQLQNDGYFRFGKSYVRYDADTTLGGRQVGVTLRIPRYMSSPRDSLQNHRRYYLGRVDYTIDTGTERKNMPLSASFLANKTALAPGQVYREADAQSTYANLSSLSAVMATNITFDASPHSSDTLDANITLHMARRHGFTSEIEGTNSAGDLGMALRLGYQNRNLFRRSAQLGIELMGAYEAIKGLEGYNDQDYMEYSAEVNLNFPEFIFPFLSRQFRRAVKAQSIVSLMYDSQNRPEFHRRVLTASWRYRWSRFNLKRQHRVDLLDLNYVFMPWISETFRNEYLADNSSRNAILRYNYENLFIMKWGYTFQYTSVPPTSQNAVYGKNAYSVRIGIETAGNLLYGLSHLFDAQYSQDKRTYTLFNIAYAEYAKFDFDLTRSLRVDSRNSVAFHLAFGLAYPYGNSDVLPYEKRYFSGGANSVRGWSVRGLGPGSFSGSDGRVDFIRQTGDMKLDMSAEWRSHLFWKIDGAAFVDAGNVWTIREYREQPGGQFRFDEFWRQIAVAYGLGLRLNFSYFIVRLDGGMKAVNPAVPSGRDHYPLIHPRFGRDFQLHFAVGLPF